MSRATPTMRDLAQRLMAHEAQRQKSSKTQSPIAAPVIERLRLPMIALMGNTGFRALLSRALALACAEVPWLRTVQVKGDGTLDRLQEKHAQLDPKDYAEGKVVLLAQLLGLLEAFIGENLTLQLVREIWPKSSFKILKSGNGAKK